MKKFKLSPTPKALWLLPLAAVSAVVFWWRHGPISRAEADRVDRICNPSKYLGKK